MVDPITLSLAASGTALGGITVGLTAVLTFIKVLQRLDNSFHIVDKIKAKLQAIKESRQSKREKKKAVDDLVKQIPDLADRLKKLNTDNDIEVQPDNDGISISANATSNDTMTGSDGAAYMSPAGVDPASNHRHTHTSVDVRVKGKYPHL